MILIGNSLKKMMAKNDENGFINKGIKYLSTIKHSSRFSAPSKHLSLPFFRFGRHLHSETKFLVAWLFTCCFHLALAFPLISFYCSMSMLPLKYCFLSGQHVPIPSKIWCFVIPPVRYIVLIFLEFFSSTLLSPYSFFSFSQYFICLSLTLKT